MTKVVVIGKFGQIASELQRVVTPQGWRVVAAGRDQLDLTNCQGIASAVEAQAPDMLINAAAYTAVDRAESEQELAMTINGVAPGILSKAAARLDIPFIHISTDHVFDGRLGPARKETERPTPVNTYGRSKHYGEESALDNGGRVLILRTAWVFSAYGRNFVKTMIDLGSKRKEIGVVNDQIGGPTGADDIASALIRIAAELIKPGQGRLGIYHFSGKPVVSWAQFAQAIFESATWLNPKPAVSPISSAEYPTAAIRPANSVLDCSKIFQDYGIEQPAWRPSLGRAMRSLRPEFQGVCF
jgi:dTDP-4-dehydrorhamnose reductase